MKVLWPFGVALRGETSSRLMLHRLKTVVVSDWGKGGVKAVRRGSGRRAKAIRWGSIEKQETTSKPGYM